MIGLLDSMLAVIEPEMPRQIDRWGGTLTEWESNVQDLKDFINSRCTMLDQGALDCYDELSGPYQLTLKTIPDGMGEIDINTLDIENFLWTGDYFGGMENKIKAKVFDEFADEYEFSHWISAVNNVVSPSIYDRKAEYTMTEADTLIAVFKIIGSTATDELADNEISIFPNPSSENLYVEYYLPNASDFQIQLYSVTGQLIDDYADERGFKSNGKYISMLNLERVRVSGLYFLKVRINDSSQMYKVNIIN